MKYLLAGAALLGISLAPIAHAQASCGDINTVTRHGLNDFEDILEDEFDEELFDTSFWMTGAEECTVSYDLDSIYSCLWVFDSLAAANAAYDIQVATMGPCLAGWRRASEIGAGDASGGYRTLKGQNFIGQGDFEDMEWMATVEEHVFDDGRDWHLWVGLAYLWF